MKIDRLLHVNIRCSPSDLSQLEKFYENALGMKSGYRSDFGRAGAWLYYDDEPLIHINAHFTEGSIEKNGCHNGSVDHIAFTHGPCSPRTRNFRCCIIIHTTIIFLLTPFPESN